MYSAIMTNTKNSIQESVVLSSCKRFVLCLEPGQPWHNPQGGKSHQDFLKYLTPDAAIYWLPVRVYDDRGLSIKCTQYLADKRNLNQLVGEFHQLNFTDFTHAETRACIHLYDNGSSQVYSLCTGTYDEDEQDIYNGLYMCMREGGMYEVDVRMSDKQHIARLTTINSLLLDSAWLRGGV